MRLCATRWGGDMSLGVALLLAVWGAVVILLPFGVTCQEKVRSRTGGTGNPSKNNDESLVIPPEKISEINETVDFVVDYMDAQKSPGSRIAQCNDYMRQLMGDPPITAEDVRYYHARRPEVSPYFNFLFAYHMGIPALDNWKETKVLYEETGRPAYIKIWQALRDYKELESFQATCYEVQSDVSDFNEDPQDEEEHTRLLKRINYCIDNPVLTEIRTVNPHVSTTSLQITYFEERVFKACRSSFSSIMTLYISSFKPLPMNQQELPFPYAPFLNMEADVDRMETEIMEMREEMEKRIDDSYKAQDYETFNRLQLKFTPVMLMADSSLPSQFAGYFDPYESLNSKCKICSGRPGYGQTIKDMREQTMNKFKADLVFVWTNPQITVNQQRSYELLVSEVWTELDKFVADLDAGEVYRLSVAIIYLIYGKPQQPNVPPSNTAVMVLPLNLNNVINAAQPNIVYPPTQSIHKPKFIQGLPQLQSNSPAIYITINIKMLAYDGLWHWDYKNNGIHNLRMAWDLLGALHEEMKCLLGRSYYAHLRQQALENTQLDLEKGAFFAGISRTIFKPCRIVDESDLVSPYCTRANHEICAPAGPLHPLQTPKSPPHGGHSLLKPKWYFKPDGIRKYPLYHWNPNLPNPQGPPGGFEVSKKDFVSREVCMGRRDYVMLYNLCRCGFRLDCGKDLNMNITCQLVENDLLRGQCRGSVGYPCKSLPLAPGKHNESCKSGYCNMNRNSCQDRPHIYHQDSGSPPISSPWKLIPTTARQVAFLGTIAALLVIL